MQELIFNGQQYHFLYYRTVSPQLCVIQLEKQFEIYREALPYYEKAFEINKSSIGVVQTLLGLYENLGMQDKVEQLRVVYEGLKE